MTNGERALPSDWKWATIAEIAAKEPNSITDGPFGSKLKPLTTLRLDRESSACRMLATECLLMRQRIYPKNISQRCRSIARWLAIS